MRGDGVSTPKYFKLSIGGKDLIIFYPQFKKDDGFVVISEDNPFPIKIKDFETLLSYLNAVNIISERMIENTQGLIDSIDQKIGRASCRESVVIFVYVLGLMYTK